LAPSFFGSRRTRIRKRDLQATINVLIEGLGGLQGGVFGGGACECCWLSQSNAAGVMALGEEREEQATGLQGLFFPVSYWLAVFSEHDLTSSLSSGWSGCRVGRENFLASLLTWAEYVSPGKVQRSRGWRDNDQIRTRGGKGERKEKKNYRCVFSALGARRQAPF